MFIVVLSFYSAMYILVNYHLLIVFVFIYVYSVSSCYYAMYTCPLVLAKAVEGHIKMLINKINK